MRLIFQIFIIYQLSMTIFYVWNMSWQYDELGILTTINELKLEKINNFYSQILSDQLNLNNTFVNFVEKILPFFIVPIRWTYSIGVSPFYYPILSLEIGDPNLQRLMVFIPHLITTALSFVLIYRCKYLHDEKFRILFIFFIFCSNSFMYWTFTLSSYGLILLGFALLLVFSEQKEIRKQNLILGIVCLLNYQYFPIVAVLILLKMRHNIKLLFQYWAPIFIMLISSAWLVVRSRYFGLHDTAEVSNMTLTEKFQITELLQVDKSIQRIFDILQYFFIGGKQIKLEPFITYTTIEYAIMSIITLVIAFLCFWHWKNNYNQLSIICFLMLALQFILWLTGLTPFIGSRHNLIIYLPLLYFVAVPIYIMVVQHSSIFTGIVMIIALCLVNKNFVLFASDHNKLNTNRVLELINDPEVTHVLLQRCNLEIPGWSLPLITREKIYYRCGDQRLMDNIDVETMKNLIFIGSSGNLQDISKELVFFGVGSADAANIRSVNTICLDKMQSTICSNVAEVVYFDP
jgi:hypothetical protein